MLDPLGKVLLTFIEQIHRNEVVTVQLKKGIKFLSFPNNFNHTSLHKFSARISTNNLQKLLSKLNFHHVSMRYQV